MPFGLLFAEKLGSTCDMTSQSAHEEPDLDRFARIVKARRDALELTQEEANILGGPSDTTFTKIENRTWRPRGGETFRKLDAGLKWVEGSAARTYFENGDPEPVPEAQDPEDASAPVEQDDRSNFEIAVELTVRMEIAARSAWIALQKAPSGEADVVIDQLDATSYLAEKLALQLAGSGEQFALRRWQVRAEVRARSENTANTDPALEDRPARLARAAGQQVHADEDWEGEAATLDSWTVARADAAREPDD